MRTLQLYFLSAFLFSIWFFYPGLVGREGLDQIRQALAHVYSDLQPLHLTLFFSFILSLTGHLASLLFVQQLLFWGGGYFVARYLYKLNKRAAWLFSLCLFLPPLFIYSGTILKDSFLLGFLSVTLAAGLRLSEDVSPQKRLWLTAIFVVALSAAILSRISGLVLLPLPLFLFWRDRGQRLRYFGIPAVILGFVMFVYMLTPQFIAYDRTYREQYFLIFDLAGISVEAGEPVFPDFILNHSEFDFQKVKRDYRPVSVDYLFFVSGENLFPVPTQESLAELKSFWFKSVLSKPVAYATHRYNVFSTFLRMPVIDYPGYSFENIFVRTAGAPIIGYHPTERESRHSFLNVCASLSRVFFSPILLLTGLIVLFGVRFKRRPNLFALQLFWFCLFYLGYLFFAAPASEFRYLLPPLFILIVANALCERREHAVPAL